MTDSYSANIEGWQGVEDQRNFDKAQAEGDEFLAALGMDPEGNHRHDYYVSVQMAEYPHEVFDKHASLSESEADALTDWLETLEQQGAIHPPIVEVAQPEVYTIGTDATKAAIREVIGDETADEDEDDEDDEDDTN